jgi:predicted TPR repeat methyltransferase
VEQEGDLSGAVSWCNKVLDEDADHAKATYRRGNAFLEAGEYGQAVADFTRYGELEAADRAHADSLVARAKRRQAAASARQREELKGFMGGL